MFVYQFILLMKNDEKYANNQVKLIINFRRAHHLNLHTIFNSFKKTHYLNIFYQ